MKFTCPCGHRIVDQTDGLPFKGHLISDTLWNDFWNAIDEAVEQPGATAREREAQCMALRKWWWAVQITYTCRQCGRLFVSGPGGSLRGYVPEGGAAGAE